MPASRPAPKRKKLNLRSPQDQKNLLAHPKTTNRKKIVGAFDDKYIKYESGSDEKLTIEKYLENVRPYLRDRIEDLKTFVSKTGSVEYRQMLSKSDISEIVSGFDTDEIIE